MKNLKKFLLVVSSLLICYSSFGQAKQDTSLYRIETLDGNEFIGKIISHDKENIIFQSESLGTITISKATVRRIDAVNKNQIKDGEYWFDNPQSTRYFWQSNGYGLKKGEGYYQNAWILFNQFNYGITDNISIGAGILPLFLFAGAPTPVWITPKVSLPIAKDKFNVGVGGLIGTVLGADEAGFGFAYGTGTLGDRNTNVSLGLGYGYASGNWADAPLVTLSAMIRTGKRGYILTENYYIGTPEEDLLMFFVGGRRLIKASGLDYGLMVPLITDGSFIAIPWLGLTIPFGKPVKNMNTASKNKK
jgi:hypothetical protein